MTPAALKRRGGIHRFFGDRGLTLVATRAKLNALSNKVFGVGVARPEMLEHDQVFLVALIGDNDASLCGAGGYEKLVLGEFAVADQRRRFHFHRADLSPALVDN